MVRGVSINPYRSFENMNATAKKFIYISSRGGPGISLGLVEISMVMLIVATNAEALARGNVRGLRSKSVGLAVRLRKNGTYSITVQYIGTLR